MTVFGKTPTEILDVADFVVKQNLIHERVRWIIQVPRSYHRVWVKLMETAKFKKEPIPDFSFSAMLKNIFGPIWDGEPGERPVDFRNPLHFRACTISYDQ